MSSTNSHHRHRAAMAAATLLIAALATGCGSSDAPAAGSGTAGSRPTTSTIPAVTPFAVKLVDYGFDAPSTVPAGLVRVQVTDVAKQEHELQVGRLNPGVTWKDIEGLLHSPAADAIATKVTMVGGVAPVDGGGSGSATLKLTAGSYGLFCFIHGWDGTSHLAHGMAKPLEVTAGATPRPPKAKGTIHLKDMAIVLPEGFDGHGRWRVANSGPQPHEAAIMRVVQGRTLGDVKAYLQSTTPPEGAPPVELVGGAAAIARGQEEWLDLDLPKGTYVFICFVPDMGKGLMPHFMEGMQTVWEQRS